jgi:site-specific DNA-cytosine methylase
MWPMVLGVHSVRVMNDCVIDLWGGIHSVSRALREEFLEARIISYDLDPWCATNMIPNHEFWLSDVRYIDPEALKQEVGRPLFVWASPPCTQYSLARNYTKTPRDLEGADSIVRTCMRIINYLQPVRFAMENPFTGMLKGQEVVAPWERYLKKTSYSMFSFPYKKETAI